MRMANMKIGPRLTLGFGIVILLMVFLGVSTQIEINQLGGLTEKLYRHPFTVSTSMLKIKGDIISMHRDMKDVELATTTEEIDKATASIAATENRVFKQFELINERFLGDKTRVNDARQLFADWKPIRDEIISLMRQGNREAAASFISTQDAEHVQKLLGATQYLTNFAFNKANEFMKNAEEVKGESVIIAYTLVAISIIISALLAMLITRSVVEPIQSALSIANRVAGGDLEIDIRVESKDEAGQLMEALRSMNDNLRNIVSTVKNTALSIASSSTQIAEGNTSLSQRTEEQASSLEETASSMEEMTGTVKQNADSATEARQLADANRLRAASGAEVVQRTVEAMSEINDSSTRIADIITTIDGIAFQTNLLALNAAVEAARAGEQGRGFAVVASEVRSLAQRSADAAKEIKNLIEDSVDKVKAGTKLVDESGKTLEEIIQGAQKVAEIITEIADASQEQATGINQVNNAITQMDNMTQDNAALVEESAAASRSMQDQSRDLTELMEFFKLASVDQQSLGTIPVQPELNGQTGSDHTQPVKTGTDDTHLEHLHQTGAKPAKDDTSEWEQF